MIPYIKLKHYIKNTSGLHHFLSEYPNCGIFALLLEQVLTWNAIRLIHGNLLNRIGVNLKA